MKFLRNLSTDPHFNMSLDEWCLEHLPSGESFFWLWRNAPSVIIGVNQNAKAEVNLEYLREHGIILARRSTGGGAVYHDLQNLNYSIVRPLDPSRLDNGAEAVQIIVDALRSFGVPAEQGGRNDIYVDGRKVSGFARRIYKDRELIHGTLMYNVDIDTLTRVLDVPGSKLNVKGVASVHSRVANLCDYLPQFASLDDLQSALQDFLAGSDIEYILSEEALAAVSARSRDHYSTPEWNLDHITGEGTDKI